MALPLHLTYSSEWPALTSDLLIRKVVALISDHIGPNPTVTSEWPTLTSDMKGTKSFSHEHNGSALTSDLLVKMAQSHLMIEDSQPQ